MPDYHSRSDYTLASLELVDLDPDPFRQFDIWFQQAHQQEPGEPHAMTLATATPAGAPSARVVLLRAYDERGFVFYTNYESPKGQELAANPRAALLFYWGGLQRQVRITGRAIRTSPAESATYFCTRPRESQLGAWASRQSSVIAGRAELDGEWERHHAEFQGREIPLPPFWGGFRVQPDCFEFWQGRASRLHDRFRYLGQGDGGWSIERLAP